jgi:parallel beta-helix repeat protein
MRFFTYLLSVLLVVCVAGCSQGANVPTAPGSFSPASHSQFTQNPFEGFPVDEPYSDYTQEGLSFMIDSAGNFQREASSTGLITQNVLPAVENINFNKSNLTASFDASIFNRGSILYDVQIVVDEILPSGSEALDTDGINTEGKPFWNFGIVPGSKTTPVRTLAIRFFSTGNPQLKGHIEYKERPFIQLNNVIIHTDGFDESDIMVSSQFGKIVSNEIIAGFPGNCNISEVYDYLVVKKLIPVGCDSAIGTMELKILDGMTPEDVVEELKFDSYLVNPEPNPILSIDYFPNDPVYDPAQPDDGRWAFQRIQAVEAWDYYSDGIINESGNANAAFGTVLAIVDTGMIKHQDFNLDGIDTYVMDGIGKNFINTSQKPIDDNGHGTSVAGISGAMGNNSFGMAGTVWNPFFLPIKSFNAAGLSSGYSIELGLAYLAQLAFQYDWTKIIVNMSFGRYSQTPPIWETAAVNYVNAAPNTILCAAAGNDKNDKSFAGLAFDISADNHYPSALDPCISVGASSRLQEGGLDIEVFEENPAPANWGTNWGVTVDLCAPGSLSIYTTDKDSTTDFRFDFGGTSASTPFVSGTAALIWSKNPAFTKSQVRQEIIDNCDKMQTHGKPLGAGRLNIYKIFLPDTTPIPTVITGNITTNTVWTPQGSPYVIQNDISINQDITLTIMPGTVVKFNYNKGLTINGTLNANAEMGDKIYFTSIRDDAVDGVDVENDGNKVPTGGSWSRLYYTNTSNDAGCILNNCEIRYGGYSSSTWMTIGIYDASPSIIDCDFLTCRGYGIYTANASSPVLQDNTFTGEDNYAFYLTGGSPTVSGNLISYCTNGIYADCTAHLTGNTIDHCAIGIDVCDVCTDVTGNTISNCTGWPVKQELANRIILYAKGNNFTGNTYKGRLVYGSTVSFMPPQEWVFTNDEASILPYAISNITIAQDSILRVEPGIVIKMDTNTGITISGTLIADAEGEDKIYFTSVKDDAADGIDITGDGNTVPAGGAWSRLYYTNTSNDAGCILNNCEVRYGGYSSSTWMTVGIYDASPSIIDCDLITCSGYGIYTANASSPVIQGTTFTGEDNYAIYLTGGSPTVSGNLISYCTNGIYADCTAHLTGNTIDHCAIGIDVCDVCTDVAGNTISNCTGWPVKQEAANRITLYAKGNIFINNTYKGRLVYGSTVSYMPPQEWVFTNDEASILPYAVSNITIAQNSILRVEPGIVIKMDTNTGITISGTLIADAEGEDKIYFTSVKDDAADGIDITGDGNTVPAGGAWSRLYYTNTSDDAGCVLNNCEIRYGGYSSSTWMTVGIYDSSPSIIDCDFVTCRGYNIYTANVSSPVLQGNTFSGADNYAFYLTGTGSPITGGNAISYCTNGIYADCTAHLTGNTIDHCAVGIDLLDVCIDVSGNTIMSCTSWPIKQEITNPVQLAGHGNIFTGNTYKGRLVSGSTVSYSPPHTWTLTKSEANFLPFAFDNITVATNSILQIEPGVIVKMLSGKIITVNGTFIADGTALNRISFTSVKNDTIDGIDIDGNGVSTPAKGDWAYIYFTDSSVDASCLLDYCYISYGGSTNGDVYCNNASPTISNSEICFSKTYGIYRGGTSSPILSGNTYHDNTSGDLYP